VDGSGEPWRADGRDCLASVAGDCLASVASGRQTSGPWAEGCGVPSYCVAGGYLANGAGYHLATV
jgi:hypothetical protein